MRLCPRCVRWSLLVILLAVLVIADDAVAIPRDPAPTRTLASEAKPLLVARRPRRGHRAPKPPKTKKAPKETPAETPTATPAPAPAAAGNPGAAPDPGNLQRGGRVEFDGRLVQGQTAKSGAIYLFARQRTDLKSMVRERENYRRDILRTVYPDWTK